MAAVLTAGTGAAQAQKGSPGSAPPPLQLVHQAITFAEHGDANRAIQIAVDLLAANPDYVPALKLKGTLLDQDGHIGPGWQVSLPRLCSTNAAQQT